MKKGLDEFCAGLRHNAGFYVKKVVHNKDDKDISIDKSGGCSLSMRKYGIVDGWLACVKYQEEKGQPKHFCNPF